MTLDAWNAEYTTKLGATTATSLDEWTDGANLRIKLIGDKGEIFYGDKMFAVRDYSASGANVVNGKASENNLTWNDLAGPSQSRGSIDFSTDDDSNIFAGSITLTSVATEGAVATVTQHAIRGTEVSSLSKVDKYVIAGTIIAGIMTVAAIPLIKDGVEKGLLGWKKMVGGATAEEEAQFELLERKVRKKDFAEFARHVSKHGLVVPKNAAQLDALADQQYQVQTMCENNAATARAVVVNLEASIALAETDIDAARDALRDAANHMKNKTPAEIAEAKRGMQEAIDRKNETIERDRRKRDKAATEQHEWEQRAHERGRIADLAKRLV